MTKDYAPPSTTKARAKPSAAKKKPRKTGARAAKESAPATPPPNKLKLLSILVLLAGGFGFGLYTLQKLPETTTPATTPASADKQASEPANQTAEPAPEKRFKFYDILPESEVVTPKDSPYTFKEKGAAKQYHYLVQTGSFRNPEDAERQKATIAFQGLKATITPSKNAQGTTWYRVSTGPFTSRSKMNSALDKLVSIGIEPLVKKINID